jgi:hypothetical protein
VNDERHNKETLTSAVLHEALGTMSVSIILECEAMQDTQRRPRPTTTTVLCKEFLLGAATVGQDCPLPLCSRAQKRGPGSLVCRGSDLCCTFQM